jgi:KipI family sensor histidine kinase inhibitor
MRKELASAIRMHQAGQIEPLGDRAFLVSFETEPAAAGFAAAVRQQCRPGVSDVVLAYRSVAVVGDPDVLDPADLQSWLSSILPAGDERTPGKELVIPVYYDGADLDEVAMRLGMTRDAVIEAHAGAVYDVFAIGFMPGYPYAGYLAPPLSGLPRRAVPRLRVPAGSVAIAGRQTGIYPRESPGGWHLLGTTPLSIVDLETGYFPISAGDRIRFVQISAPEFEARRHERL